MTKHVTLTDLYGAPALQLQKKGLGPLEIAEKLQIPDASRAKVAGIIHRQNTAIANDSRDLSICDEIESGTSDTEIAAAYSVGPRHVADLRKELVTLDGI